ncbi:hypothetical protein [Streptomyces sp. URMC 129]|uniref:hypothetical protein n=1 Tax=Streptomyces sp. URMC 129 TaxID=3423407 RepID=UPI003F1BEE06
MTPRARLPRLPHLHLHLEPEQRKRRLLGVPGRAPRSKEEFFAAHRVGGGDRLAVTPADVRRFLLDLHAEQRAEGADYVEVRVSPRRLLTDGASWADVCRTVHATLAGLERPAVRAILLINRDSPQDFTEEFADAARALPPAFVGLDLAGDELTHPDVAPFKALFAAAGAAGLPASVHAGEFGTADDVWRALDDLGARRIGHGLAAVTSRALTARLAAEGVLVEVSLTSNLALGAVDSLAAHPVRELVERGVPVSFNTDVPLHTGGTLPGELARAATLLGEDTVRALQSRAAAFRFG